VDDISSDVAGFRTEVLGRAACPQAIIIDERRQLLCCFREELQLIDVKRLIQALKEKRVPPICESRAETAKKETRVARCFHERHETRLIYGR
jgi:hypothetical protein